MKLKAKKCNFFQREVNFLGHVVSQEGIKTDLSKITLVKEWKILSNVTVLMVEKLLFATGAAFCQTEKNYCVTRKEMLAVVYFIKQFKHYLLGREFLLRTDHRSLVWLHKMKEPEGQMARWLEQLGPYTFKIEHRSGKQHGNADAMSRISCASTSKQCKYRTFDSDNKRFSHVRELRETLGGIKEDEEDVLDFDRLFSVNVSECAPISGN